MISEAPTSESSSWSCPAVMCGPIETESFNNIGPVSRPASIFMIVTPDSDSPSMIALLMGAAPRNLGSSDA